MSIAAQIGHNVARIRADRGMSLSALAGRSNLSKATLSELERGASNPTISTVWALANALDVPFGELVSDTHAQTAGLADESATVHLIEQHAGPPRGESYLLQIAAGGQRVSAPHGRGVREQATVLSGRIKAGPTADDVVLGEGETFDFQADRPHGYFSLGGPASVLVRMEYPDVPLVADDNVSWQPLPRDETQWARLETLVARLLLATSQSGNTHSLRLNADDVDQAAETRLRKLLAGCMRTTAHQPVQGFVSRCTEGLELIVLPVPDDRIDIGPPPDAGTRNAPLRTAVELHALRNAAELAPPQVERLRELQRDGASAMRTLPADVLDTHGLGGDTTAKRESGGAWPWLAVAAACLAGRHLPATPLDALLVESPDAAGLLPMIEELCPSWQVVQAGVESLPADAPSCQVLLAFEALQQADAAGFLHRAARTLDTEGLLLIAEDLPGCFAHPRERVLMLMRHHLARMLPPLAQLARGGMPGSDAGLSDSPVRETALLDRLPAVAADMLNGDVEQAAAGINRLRRDLAAVQASPGTLAGRLDLELDALGRALDAPEELATHPQRLIQLAGHAGLQLIEHRRVYPSDGPHELDAGTHLFAFARRGAALQP